MVKKVFIAIDEMYIGITFLLFFIYIKNIMTF